MINVLNAKKSQDGSQTGTAGTASKKNTTEPDKCLRCGECCHFMIKKKRIRCQYLMKMQSGLHFCRIYQFRLGQTCHNNFPQVTCKLRTETRDQSGKVRIIPGCPYNDEIQKKTEEEKENNQAV